MPSFSWRAWVSAHTGAGIEELLSAIGELLGEDAIELEYVLAPGQGRLRARFYQAGAVLCETADDAGHSTLKLRMPRQDFVRSLQEAGLDPTPWLPAPTTIDNGEYSPESLPEDNGTATQQTDNTDNTPYPQAV